jgi:hypothetical protein
LRIVEFGPALTHLTYMNTLSKRKVASGTPFDVASGEGRHRDSLWLMGLSRAVDTRIVRPRFGRVTQVLSVVFMLAGLDAAVVGVNSGHQTTPGSADNGLILITLGAAYLLVGAGLWMEYVWAWWIGLTLTSIVVVWT